MGPAMEKERMAEIASMTVEELMCFTEPHAMNDCVHHVGLLFPDAWMSHLLLDVSINFLLLLIHLGMLMV